MADYNGNNGQMHAHVHQGITVSDDYNRLRHKPTINGVPIDGDMSAEELNLLTNELSGYEEISLGVGTRDSFMLVVGETGETSKLKINELAKGRFRTITKIDDEVLPGDYVFKKMED